LWIASFNFFSERVLVRRNTWIDRRRQCPAVHAIEGKQDEILDDLGNRRENLTNKIESILTSVAIKATTKAKGINGLSPRICDL
jgi:hypothetical protein